jgi:transcriptional regulator with PAS, ATPase and Fis domain
MSKFKQGYRHTPSQRQLAKELGIPRTTLQHWLKREESTDAD